MGTRENRLPSKSGSSYEDTNERIHKAVPILMDAYLAAEDVGLDPWEFAVEITELQSRGLTVCDLRWMICKGITEHAEELYCAIGRKFRRTNKLAFSSRSCFRLTPTGIAWIEKLLSEQLGVTEQSPNAPEPVPPPSPQEIANPSSDYPSTNANGRGTRTPLKPIWDSEVRELRLGGRLIKQFRGPASNQMLILAAFQELNWPRRIDDPLRPAPEIDPKKRLHDTINALNRNQKAQLLEFSGDGTGSGVFWKLVSSSPVANGSSHDPS